MVVVGQCLKKDLYEKYLRIGDASLKNGSPDLRSETFRTDPATF
jgi:hypothetical protein